MEKRCRWRNYPRVFVISKQGLIEVPDKKGSAIFSKGRFD
uniref:Uncharacterized protein n=1 Tax=Rhizophora mucronata TaxID=61149 RepID=A0A2P2PPN2_RHIMU